MSTGNDDPRHPSPSEVGPADDQENLFTFCRQVRARSAEHRRAIHGLLHADAPGLLVGLLRQELDSMVRVIFLLAQNDRDYRARLVAAAVNGQRWQKPNGTGRITDRDMVDLATTLHGWTASVYKFGCAFIHLSDLHDHAARDPIEGLPPNERDDLFRYLRFYHGGPHPGSGAFDDVIHLLPRVFEKIAGNLECYVKRLEQGGVLEDSPDDSEE